LQFLVFDPIAHSPSIYQPVFNASWAVRITFRFFHASLAAVRPGVTWLQLYIWKSETVGSLHGSSIKARVSSYLAIAFQ
jgi:hypothetical protein